MAQPMMRGIMRAATCAARRSVPTVGLRSMVAPKPLAQSPALLAATPTRSYVTTAKYSRDEVLEKLDAFQREVVSANWADYWYLVYNGPCWEAELEKLTTIVQPYLYEVETGKKFADVQEMMDVLYVCEDIR